MTERSHPKDDSPNALPSEGLVPLESILCTEELHRRPSRPPEYEEENRALAALVQALADSPRTILQTLADKILEVLKADSAGISLMTKEDGRQRFYWPAIAGLWKPHIGGGTPRDFGPCGDVLDRNAALLFRHFERRYTYFLPVTPPVEECLLVPFYVEGKAVGTIWAIAHDDRRKFDAEDLRQLESLGRFASAAYQAAEFLDGLEQRGEALRQSHIKLAERIAELQKSDTKAQDARRAALNLMEDAVQSRQAMERLNAELRESEERFRSLVSVITDVSWTTDPEGRFITRQAAWEAYTGQTWKEHGGFGWVNAIHPEDRERIKEIWTDACASHKRYESEGRVWHAPTQRWRYFTAKATPLLNTDGGVREWVGTCIDCDDQRRVEENLEKVVAERTAALQRTIDEREQLQDQLLQAQKMESLGTLASGVAHDFNNLLNIVSGYATTMRRDSQNPSTVAEAVAVIEETVKRGADLVRQLLILGRKSEAKFTTLSLNSVIENLAGLLKETFSKTIILTLNLERRLPAINGNENQLRQILLNLCVNSSEAMPQGGRISITTETVSREQMRPRISEAEAGRYVLINVSDTGIGMDDNTEQHIFEPFFTTKSEGQGTGLGLAVVYGIVKNHSGFIEVESEVGRGTSFRIYLPASGVSAEQSSEAEPANTNVNAEGRGETILFVDDEERQLSLMQRVLEREGYKVLGATDGTEAVEVFNRHKDEVAVVVMDLGLPNLNGWEAFQQMREIRPSLQALIATGFAPPELKAKIAQGGLGEVIVKPYNLSAIVEKISRVIQQARIR